MPFISGVKCERCGRTSYYPKIPSKLYTYLGGQPI